MRDSRMRIDLELQYATRDVDRARNMASIEFGRLAHVNDDGIAAIGLECGGVDFPNFGACV